MPTPKFEKGQPKTGGRQKGSTNKFTDLKQSFLDAFEKIEVESKKDEKIKSLYELATKNDRNQMTFYQIISKMLPSNVTLGGAMNVTYLVSEKFLPKVEKKE